MTQVQGIGGVFVYSNDAAKLANWYQEMLGVTLETHPDGDKYFKVFVTRDAESSVLRENPVFAIYQAHKPLAQSGRGFMLNLRVTNLVILLQQLRSQGVEVQTRLDPRCRWQSS
jgi:uncharacterized glyoxalase superfamily protein PhnB